MTGDGEAGGPPGVPGPGEPASTRPRRRPRRDAEANRERVLAAAAAAMLREGRTVPLATIAAEAGVGVGTLYRRYADRQALLHALEYRPTACSTRSWTRSTARISPASTRSRSTCPAPWTSPISWSCRCMGHHR